MNNNKRAAVRAVALALTLTLPPIARAVDAEPAPAADLSLEELLKTDVQTASRKSQRLLDVAAAVFVISREDIERSGATSIPEALRMAPGVEVARSANNRWAVSARGFNGRFSNKLLVLMDGRSIYSPLFSGVLWEMEDTLLDDIDRIEVIRGPGAALWGANAVNGVINIITRKARDTRGTLAVAGIGTEERGFATLRHGFAAGDGDMRVWAKGYLRDTSVDLQGGAGNDYSHAAQIGFRGDWAFDARRRFMLSGSVHTGPTGDRWSIASLTDPRGYVPTDIRQENQTSHLLARHEWLSDDGSEAVLQGYVQNDDLNVIGEFRDQRWTVDLDFQHRPRLSAAHDLVWGLGYRESRDRITTGGNLITLDPGARTWRMASAFLQDDITVVPDRLHLVLGSRFEYNSFTGYDPQPNARAIWTPAPQQTVWGAVSRALRTPARVERDAQIDLQVIPGSALQPPVLLRVVPPPDHAMLNETVKAFELGYRQQFAAQLSLDVAVFYNRYSHLRSGVQGNQSFEFTPVPHVVQTIVSGNTIEARTRGVEVAVDWHLLRGWRVQPAYTYTRIEASADANDPFQQGAAADYTASAPRHQLSLRSSLTLADRSQFDLWLRYVSRLPAANPAVPEVSAYTALDLRYAWRVTPGLELSLVGQNLLARQHVEFIPDNLPSQTLQVQRSLYVKAKWQF